VFDIHGGGIDLVFPHHENEVAQSTCAFGHPAMANVFMHNGFLQVEGKKMSKSEGNFVTINELLATDRFGGRAWSGQVLRLAMLRSHYRQPIDFTVASLQETIATLERLFDKAEGHTAGPVDAEVLAVLCDDLNLPGALARIHHIKDPAILAGTLSLLGFSMNRDDLKSSGPQISVDEEAVQALIDARIAARNGKDWAESDRIRDELLALNIQIMDSKDPVTGELKTEWEVKR